MRQCFLMEYREDDEWHPVSIVFTTRVDVDSRVLNYAEVGKIAQEDIRARLIWTSAEYIKLHESGIKAFERPGGPIAWIG